MINFTKRLYSNSGEYKDFFNNAEYSSESPNEISYRKVIISEESIPKEIFDQNLVLFERIRAENMLGVYKYLVYKLPKLNVKLKELEGMKFFNPNYDTTLEIEIDKITKQIRWFEKNINFFRQKLSNIEKSHTFITPKYGFFCNSYDKIPYNSSDDAEKDNQKLIGRLYSHKSIQGLSSEIRYYLFKGEYTDFDMVNAHPSILYGFSKQQDLKLNGSLKQYVENRSSIFEKVRKELIQFENMEEETITDRVIKQRIIELSNRFYNDDVAPTLKNLYKDFHVIREHLFQLLRSSDFFTREDKLEYNNAILNSINKKIEQKSLSPNHAMDKAKILIQIFYCQTQESYYITRLSNFLREKYVIYLNNDNIKYFTDYYPNTDKKVNLNAIHTLFIIPFFDGIYVSSPNMSFNNSVRDFVDDFNKLNKESSIRFEHKVIEQKVENIEDTKELEKFLIIHNWSTKQNSRRNWNLYLKRSGIITKFLRELQFLDCNEKEISLEKSEKSEEYWDIAYQDLINDMKSEIYDNLLIMKFKNEHELNICVQNMENINDSSE